MYSIDDSTHADVHCYRSHYFCKLLECIGSRPDKIETTTPSHHGRSLVRERYTGIEQQKIKNLNDGVPVFIDGVKIYLLGMYDT